MSEEAKIVLTTEQKIWLFVGLFVLIVLMFDKFVFRSKYIINRFLDFFDL